VACRRPAGHRLPGDCVRLEGCLAAAPLRGRCCAAPPCTRGVTPGRAPRCWVYLAGFSLRSCASPRITRGSLSRRTRRPIAFGHHVRGILAPPRTAATPAVSCHFSGGACPPNDRPPPRRGHRAGRSPRHGAERQAPAVLELHNLRNLGQLGHEGTLPSLRRLPSRRTSSVGQGQLQRGERRRRRRQRKRRTKG
jgi:hypothetical protein